MIRSENDLDACVGVFSEQIHITIVTRKLTHPENPSALMEWQLGIGMPSTLCTRFFKSFSQ